MAMLRISRSGRIEGLFYLPEVEVVIGRSEGTDIQLLDSRVSRRHAVIRQSVAGFVIQDFSTKNGTYVNHEAVDKSLLFHGDEILIGGYAMTFLEEESIADLDPDNVSLLDESVLEGLELPGSLRADGAARAQTVAGASQPPPAVNRMDRRRPAPVPLAPPADDDGIGASVEFSLSELELMLEDLPVPESLTAAARKPAVAGPPKARRVQKPARKRTAPGGKGPGEPPPWAND